MADATTTTDTAEVYTPSRAQLHEAYLDHSPAYRDMFENYGASIPLMIAVNWTASHGMTIPNLIDSGDLAESDFEHNLSRERTRVHTLPLLMAMGY